MADVKIWNRRRQRAARPPCPAAFTPAPLRSDAAATLFGQLDSWAGALKPLRG
jgi:hypothetical protein